jgi:hypothetical protein
LKTGTTLEFDAIDLNMKHTQQICFCRCLAYPEQPLRLLHFILAQVYFGACVGFPPDNRLFAVASKLIAPLGPAVTYELSPP